MEIARASPGCGVQLAFVLRRMDLRDDAAGFGVLLGIRDHAVLETGATGALERGFQPRRALRVHHARVVVGEAGVGKDPDLGADQWLMQGDSVETATMVQPPAS